MPGSSLQRRAAKGFESGGEEGAVRGLSSRTFSLREGLGERQMRVYLSRGGFQPPAAANAASAASGSRGCGFQLPLALKKPKGIAD